MNNIELANRFTYHPPQGNQVERYQALREAALQFAFTIKALTPESREQSLAFTALEESVSWANAAIARNEYQAMAQTMNEINRRAQASEPEKKASQAQPPDGQLIVSREVERTLRSLYESGVAEGYRAGYQACRNDQGSQAQPQASDPGPALSPLALPRHEQRQAPGNRNQKFEDEAAADMLRYLDNLDEGNQAPEGE